MEYNIETISTKRFLLIGLLPIPLVIGLPLWMAGTLDNSIFAAMIIPLLAIMIFCAFRYSKRNSLLRIEDNQFIYDGKKIDYDQIDGYHINDIGLIFDSFDIRLKNGETVIITGWNFGKRAKTFSEATGNLIKHLKSGNSESEELNYQDVHVKQYRFMRPLIYAAIPIVIALDIYMIYLKITDGRNFPWQLFFLNFLALSMIPYLKKRK